MTEEKEPAPNPKRALWDRMCTTNPAHTKQVKPKSNRGREFTAIDAHHQILKCTEEWGPIGGKWGFTHTWIDDPELWIAEVTLFYPDDDENRCEVSHMGTANKNTKWGPDKDGIKKCLTDGRTKSLSLCGVSADVFLGKFEDNSYLADLRAEFANPNGSGVSTGADSLPPKSERVPPPNQARLTGKTRMKQLAESVCGDKDWFDFLQGLAADLGFPTEPDAMTDEQFAHIIEELAAMEQSRLEFLQAGRRGSDGQSTLGIPDGPPMSSYDEEGMI